MDWYLDSTPIWFIWTYTSYSYVSQNSSWSPTTQFAACLQLHFSHGSRALLLPPGRRSPRNQVVSGQRPKQGPGMGRTEMKKPRSRNKNAWIRKLNLNERSKRKMQKPRRRKQRRLRQMRWRKNRRRETRPNMITIYNLWQWSLIMLKNHHCILHWNFKPNGQCWIARLYSKSEVHLPKVV